MGILRSRHTWWSHLLVLYRYRYSRYEYGWHPGQIDPVSCLSCVVRSFTRAIWHFSCAVIHWLQQIIIIIDIIDVYVYVD